MKTFVPGFDRQGKHLRERDEEMIRKAKLKDVKELD